MKRLAFFLLFGLLALGDISPAAAQISEVDSVAALSGISPTGTAVYLASYYCSGSPCKTDGGEGLLLKGAACTPDGGSTFVDGSGNCWYRQNLNGDLRQWGITSGSKYDASIYSTATTPTAVSSATPIIGPAYGALAKVGITALDTHQVSIYLNALSGASPIIPVSSSLTCGATGGGQYAGGVYAGLNTTSGTPLNTKPGTIFLEHGAYIQFGASFDHNNNPDSTGIHNCIIVPEWLQTGNATACMDGNGNQGQTFAYPAVQYSDLEAIRANMIVCGDQALFINGASGVRAHDLWIYGFDNPVHIFKGDHFILTNALIDGDICAYSESGGGITKLNEVTCDTILTRQVLTNSGAGNSNNNHCTQSDTSNGGTICNEEYWQISGISASTISNSFGRPNCKLTLVKGQPNGKWNNAPDPNLLSGVPDSLQNSQGDPVTNPMWVSNLNATTGGLGCIGRGPHPIKNVSYSGGLTATLDLLNSEYATGSGNLITATVTWDACSAPPCTIRIATGDVDAMAVGETLDDPTHTLFSAGTAILDVVREAKGPDPYDGYIAEITVNAALPSGHNTGADTSITLNGSPNGINLPTGNYCDANGNGQCATISTAEHAIAFQPPSSLPPSSASASSAVAKLPESNSHYYAAGFMDNGTAGLCLIDGYSFARHFGFAIQDANSTCLLDKDGDDNGELNDRGGAFFIVSGNSNQVSAQGNESGKSGVSIVNDLYQLADNQSSAGRGLIYSAVGTPTNIVLQTSYSTTNFPSDQGTGAIGGKGTAGICQTWDTTHSKCTTTEEYVTYEITGAQTLLLLARARFFTASLGSSLNGYTFVTSSVSRPTACDSFSSTQAPVTDEGLNAVEQIGGCLQLANFKDPEAKNFFVGHNATYTQLSNTALPQLNFYYEDPTAFASMGGCGNVLLLPTSWNCPQQLAHGQVYLSLSLFALTYRLQLCPSNGSGLIVNSQLLSIPSGCLILMPTSTTGASVSNYIYAAGDSEGVLSVTNGSPGIKITTVGTTPYKTGDQVQVTCFGINAPLAANMSGLATMQSSSSFNFNGSSFPGGAYTYGGTCTLLGLVASTTGHSTAPNGVETMNGDTTKTLVGLAYVDSSQAFNDLIQKRDVVSWFNRKSKTCLASLSSDKTGLMSTSFTAVDSSLSCEFVKLGQSSIGWSIAGYALDSASVSVPVVTTAANFDASGTNAPEFTAGSNTKALSIGVTGIDNGSLTEGVHNAAVYYKVDSSTSPGATYKSGSSIELRLQQ